MPRSEPITRLEVAACPTHRMDVKHYAPYEVGCACLSDARPERRPPQRVGDPTRGSEARGQPTGGDGGV